MVKRLYKTIYKLNEYIGLFYSVLFCFILFY